MPTFSIDNDRVAADFQDLTLDQTSGVQSPTDGNDTNVTLSSGELDGLDSDFETFLAGLGLSSDQKAFAVNTDAASSSGTFIEVSADPGETLNGLTLVADPSTALSGVTTLNGDSIYVHVDASGDYATLWTSSDDTGRIVGAVALTGETVDNATTHTATAGVQMVMFEAIAHTDTGSQDETLALGDVLNVAVDTAVSFNFDQLDAGNFLWAAVGDSGSAMLITGQDLNVKDSGKPSAVGLIDKGGTDPSDAVNTSKASDTTIGINAQHFAPTNTGDGATGVFTFVTGYAPLDSTTPVYTGQNVKQIDYQDYINVSSASVFISQLTGGSAADIHFSFWEAGGGEGTANVDGADHVTGDLLPEEGYSGANSYIGNQDTDTHLKDDTAVNIASVTIGAYTWTLDPAVNGHAQGGITVTITGNDVIVDGAQANDLISFTAVNDGADPLDGTFNRIDIQALQDSASFDIGYVSLSSGGLTSADLGSHLFIDDDGPAIGASNDVSKPNDLEVANTLNAADDSLYVLTAGADGQQSFTIVGPEDTSGDFQWTYDDTSHTSITGTYKGSDLYTLALNSDGTYTFDMIGTLAGSSVPLSSNVIHAGGPSDTVDVAAKAPSTDYARLVGHDGTSNPLVNASHGFVGVDNGNLDNGESLTLSLYEANGDLIDFSGITIGTKSAGISHYDYFVHMSDGSDIQVGDNVQVGKNGTITVSDPDPSDNVLIESVTIFKVDGNAIKIGLGNIQFILPPADVQLDFTAELKDGDNDAVTTSFLVDIDGNNDGNFDATANSLGAIQPSAINLDSTASIAPSFSHDLLHQHHQHGDYFM